MRTAPCRAAPAGHSTAQRNIQVWEKIKNVWELMSCSSLESSPNSMELKGSSQGLPVNAPRQSNGLYTAHRAAMRR